MTYSQTEGRSQGLVALNHQFLLFLGGFRRLQFISNARVPIVKFEGNFNISCDLSVNNLSGQMKSKILYWISGIDNRFRNLVLLASFCDIVMNLKHRVNVKTLLNISICAGQGMGQNSPYQ